MGGLYKGVASPLVGQMFFRMLLFTSHGQAKRTLTDGGKREMTTVDYFLAGAFAWSVGTLAECPIDLFKSQMQVQIIRAKSIPGYVSPYKNIVDCVRQIFQANGLRGPYQGVVPHLIRNSTAGALHLGLNDIIRLRIAKANNIHTSQLSIWHSLVAGGVGGLAYWVYCFPRKKIRRRRSEEDEELR
jgi:solute carrier family 25 carnitine/acylcarnitine transporter 20/29